MRKLAILIVLTSVLAANCGFSGKRIKGNGQVTTENRNVGNFVGVSSHGAFDVYVSIGPTTAVKIEAESNFLPYIETYIDEANSLRVQTKKGVWLNSNKAIKVYVTAPRFGKIFSVGSGAIIGETRVTDAEKLDLQVRGNGRVELDVDAPEVVTVLTGNGGLKLKGQSKVFECSLQGNGNIKAYDLMAEDTKVSILGNGDAEVYASVSLDVTIGGNGTVRYKGNAQPSTHITGNGNIKQVK
jgi:hypothetical protein